MGGWSSPGPGRLEEKGVLGKKAAVQPVLGEALRLFPLLLFSAHQGLSTGPLQIFLEAEAGLLGSAVAGDTEQHRVINSGECI